MGLSGTETQEAHQTLSLPFRSSQREKGRGGVPSETPLQCGQGFALKKDTSSWALVAHACNPSYLEGRNQEDCGLKPTPGANSL
jgi:hypothetical protein